MKLNEYQEAAMRTASNQYKRDIIPSALSLAGETGEYVDLIKKECYHGHNYNPEKRKLELGDILWSLAAACEANGTTLNEIAIMNIDKLSKRYPQGFTSEDSINRKGE